ncbi:MAG: dTDP-6-deoxy-L-hexose 3-O-methyltransferase [Verrucomicrobia bacterium GWC2_42_7]|nr:MAG: dTDP-6-deoxy-L-hexose 3-O-methyltransferase [Verrucomicrobia bacterium GWC2_42_7]
MQRHDIKYATIQGNPSLRGGLRSPLEQVEGEKNRACFDKNPEKWEQKMENFPKYVKKQNITRFLALYELFKQVINVKGSIIECGVFQGFGLMSFAKISSILEPTNLTRRIYGFDSFEGFPKVSDKDISSHNGHVKEGDLYASSYEELNNLIEIYDSTRFLGHIPKVNLIKGNAEESIPHFVENNPHLVVSLLFLDFDLYEPTMAALKHFVPRMPRGAIIAFDELDNPLWPGETLAMLDFFDKKVPKLQRFDFDPYISYCIV